MRRHIAPIAVAIAVAFALTTGAGMAMAHDTNGGNYDGKQCQKYKYKIKHYPPGQNTYEKTSGKVIYVGSWNAVEAHKRNHGDKFLGKKCVKYKEKKEGPKHKY